MPPILHGNPLQDQIIQMATAVSLVARGILPVNPSGATSPSPPRIQDILPHILLFLVLILAYFPPPFRGRGALVCLLAALLDWLCTVSTWPPNVGDTRPMKYGIASSWIFILPVIERILIHTPEREFWRVDDVQVVPAGPNSNTETPSDTPTKHPPPPPRESTWQKLLWSISLYSTPRAVGWNFGSRRINTQREAVRKQRLAATYPTNGTAFEFPKAEFVMTKIARVFTCYITLDLVMVANRKLVIPPASEWWSLDREPMLRILWLEILMGITVYAGMTMQFDVAAAVGVGLGLNEPEDWPPLFGSLTECYTIANVWGKFWHQYMRQPCLGTSHYCLLKLRTIFNLHVPKHSLLAYFIHLTTAFAISTFFHALSVGAVAPGFTPTTNIIVNMALFFLVQPPAAIFESVVGVFYEKYVLRRLLRLVKERGKRPEVGNANGIKNHQIKAVQEHDGAQNGDTTWLEVSASASTSTDILTAAPNETNTEETSVTATSEWEIERERQEEQSQEKRKMAVLFWSAAFCRTFGYIWVFCWFYLAGRWFIRPYIDVGIIEWGLPFSLANWLIVPDKC